MRILGLDFRRGFTGQGNLVLRFSFAVRAAQILEQIVLVLVGQAVIATFLAYAGAGQLFQERRDRHFEFCRKL